MSQKDWQVGPVLKNKPDSQGTLFRGGTKYSSDARFPKHYTPERLAEVKEGMGLRQSGDYRVGGPPSPIFGEGTAPERRRMIDTVARSTVPVEDIKGVDFAPGQAVPEDSGEAGAYHRYGFGNGEQPKVNPKISIAKGQSENSTVIHEIGHHVSAEAGTSTYSTPSERGAEEGRADAYAFKHFRDRGGRPLKSQYTYLGAQWQRGDDSKGFNEAYGEQTAHIPDPLQMPGSVHERAMREDHPIQTSWNWKQGASGQPGLFDLADTGRGEHALYDKPELHHP